LQKRYSKKWRYVKGIREAIKRHDRRTKNILVDSCNYVSRRLVEIAKDYNALIVLEDLNRLRSRVYGSRRFNKKYRSGHTAEYSHIYTIRQQLRVFQYPM